MTTPTVSVIMAAYNGAALVGETVRSLQAQGFADWELVAVDDCSKDDTVAVLEGFGDPRIRVYENPINVGKGAAVRVGLKYATGDIILIQDADLELDPGLVALTGETGAGKTIVTQAIGLLLGAKGDAASVGAAASEAFVEAELDARRVAPVAAGAVSRRGDRAARTPELHERSHQPPSWKTNTWVLWASRRNALAWMIRSQSRRKSVRVGDGGSSRSRPRLRAGSDA